MRSSLFILLILYITTTFSQVEIKGTIYDKNGVLEGAAVYFNNTMLGTSTNNKGEFSIKTKKGNYNLVVSFLGYKKIVYNLNTSSYIKPLVFVLEEETNTLKEIIIKKTVYDQTWKYNLSTFKREFIGTTELAKDCEILNEKTLYFDFDAKKNLLTAFARAPLKIKHKGLGYLITYDLEEFIIYNNKVTYLGYSRYQNLKGSKRKQRKWTKKRAIAYYGSVQHFLQSLVKNTTYKDGFIINQFKRVANAERPSEIKIKKARELIKLNRNKINFSKKITIPKTPLDSALIVVRKVRLPKFKDYLYESKVPVKNIIAIKNGKNYLNFKNNISIVYTKELEEKNYILRNAFSKKRKPLPQTSSIIPINFPSEMDKNGYLINPLDIFFEGYWAYEKFANSLPLDYSPVGNSQ